MDLLERASSRVNSWVESLLGFLGITMALVVALQVFCRYALNSSLFWSEELARILLIWLTFLGGSAAYCRKVHPAIDIVSAKLGGKTAKVCRRGMGILSLLFFIVMIFYGTSFAYFARLQISPALHLPKWIIYSAVPVSGIIFLLHGLLFLLQDFLGKSCDDR